MNFINNVGFIVLAIYLILIGVTGLVPAIVIPNIIYAILALIAGVFILIGR